MNVEYSNQDVETALQRARDVKAANEEMLMAKANVIGVGVGRVQRRRVTTTQVGVVVLVSRKMPRAQLSEEDLVPSEIDGVPVDVQAVGEVRAQV